MDDYEPAEFDDAFGFSRQSDTERTSGFRDGKKIYLLSRSDFSQELFESIAREICRIYKESVMPTLKKMTPELKDSYFVPDFDEEIN